MAAKKPLVLYVGPNKVQEIVAGDTLDPVAAGLAVAFAGTTDTQTLTNKTLTAAKLTTDGTLSTGTPVAYVYATTGQKLAAFQPTVSGVGFLVFRTQIAGGASSSVALGVDSTDPIVHINVIPKGAGELRVNGVKVPTNTSTDTLTNKTLTAPIIGATQWGAATHTHVDASTGGALSAASIASGTLDPRRLGQTQSKDFPIIAVADHYWFMGVVNIATFVPSAAHLLNVVYAYPFIAPTKSSYTTDFIALDIVTPQVAGKCRVGIYTSDPTTGLPTTLVLENVIDCSAVGVQRVAYALTESTLTPGGKYWFAIDKNDSTISLRCVPAASTVQILGLAGVVGTNFGATPYLGISAAFAYGALPASFPGGGAYFNGATLWMPLAGLRFSA